MDIVPSSFDSTKLYTTGIITSVSRVDSKSPNIRDMDMGAKSWLPDITRGIRPITVVVVVSLIVLILLLSVLYSSIPLKRLMPN